MSDEFLGIEESNEEERWQNNTSLPKFEISHIWKFDCVGRLFQRETGEDWSKIFHIRNILIDNNIVQIDGWEFNPEVTSYVSSSPLDSSFTLQKFKEKTLLMNLSSSQ